MCGKRSLKSSALTSSEDTEDKIMTNGNLHNETVTSTTSSPNGNGEVFKFVKPKDNETKEEKLRRRKIERKMRRKYEKQKSSDTDKDTFVTGKGLSKKLLGQFNQVWDRESSFVNQVIQCLPEVRQPNLLQDELEKEEEYISQEGDDLQDEAKEKVKTQKFHAKVRKNLEEQGVEHTTERAKTYQELKERLHRKIAELAQKPNEKKRERKQKRKLKRAAEKKEKSNKGMKLISQTAANASGVKSEDSNSTSEQTKSEKTPLKKKPVVKSNGEIVYSKFDFISKHKGDHNSTFPSSSLSSSNKNVKGNVGKPKPDELLRKVEKHEKKISNLVTHGKQSEAVSLAETQKWETAMKRADGEKVRDDAYLLKKSIKRNEKLKQLSKKKWKERVDRVEKQKEARQQKRQTNIKARKDDKTKKTKKIMRKRGRIA